MTHHIQPSENLEAALEHEDEPAERKRLIDEAYELLGEAALEAVVVEDDD